MKYIGVILLTLLVVAILFCAAYILFNQVRL